MNALDFGTAERRDGGTGSGDPSLSDLHRFSFLQTTNGFLQFSPDQQVTCNNKQNTDNEDHVIFVCHTIKNGEEADQTDDDSQDFFSHRISIPSSPN